MGKKKGKAEYNDFLDGEKLRDNSAVRTTLEDSSSLQRTVSPPPPREKAKGKGKGKSYSKPKTPALTHFLCLPLVNDLTKPQLQQSLDVFKEDMAKEEVVSSKAIRPLGTLHLTIAVMALKETALEEAGKCLQDLDLQELLRNAQSRLTESTPDSQEVTEMSASEKGGSGPEAENPALSLSLRSLVPMGAARNTSVLYAKPVDATARLYPFASALRDHFMEKGFLVRETRPLKLHATIVNTIYAKPRRKPPPRPQPLPTRNGPESEPPERKQDDDGTEHVVASRGEGRGLNPNRWLHFDATSIIERYADTVWADGVRIEKVQICKMGAKKILNEDGEVVEEEYEEVFSKAL
ncbi:AKAP7 2'5' RNA ligase-like domain-containing protein [Massariosphaeria phaeospora]|uniref:AKAP7 2'5' RNA ligase-like domain-containing protein n=1 Tax=Massariosphaeria phaeospora TaxID=100035 RepID=A0A7C8HZC0_9PLEO|nr:AKAP7 2'5' RNA ligase-like domain-containing protein [Massariosphaeria phaeospora]